jgi:hypothetical protein
VSLSKSNQPLENTMTCSVSDLGATERSDGHALARLIYV